jgi:uncharacterized membrane protein YjfL (UPF0719 family)
VGGTSDAQPIGLVVFACCIFRQSRPQKEYTMEWIRPEALLGSVMFALIGVVIFWVCFIIIDKITPYDLWGEIVEKHNMALGLVVASMSLGICIIVAAAIH